MAMKVLKYSESLDSFDANQRDEAESIRRHIEMKTGTYNC